MQSNRYNESTTRVNECTVVHVLYTVYCTGGCSAVIITKSSLTGILYSTLFIQYKVYPWCVQYSYLYNSTTQTDQTSVSLPQILILLSCKNIRSARSLFYIFSIIVFPHSPVYMAGIRKANLSCLRCSIEDIREKFTKIEYSIENIEDAKQRYLMNIQKKKHKKQGSINIFICHKNTL